MLVSGYTVLNMSARSIQIGSSCQSAFAVFTDHRWARAAPACLQPLHICAVHISRQICFSELVRNDETYTGTVS